jgi:hypothetical protein
MTEDERLNCRDPERMLAYLSDRATSRSLRHFATACCRRIWHLFAHEEELDRLRKPIAQTVPEQYMLLVMCADEKQQLELLARFQGEGLECKVLLS